MVTAVSEPKVIDAELVELADGVKRQFLALADKAARGMQPKASDVQAACIAAGKPIDAFRRTVDRIRRRIEALAEVETAKQHEALQQQHAAKVMPLDDERKALQVEFNAKLQAIMGRIVENHSAYMNAQSMASYHRNNANRVLRETAGDAERGQFDPLNVKID